MSKTTWEEVQAELEFLGYKWEEAQGNGNLYQVRILKNTREGVPMAITLQCERDNPDSFVEALENEYEIFDADTQVYKHLDNEGHGFGNAPYHIRDVLKDMEDFHNTLKNDSIAASQWLEGYTTNINRSDAENVLLRTAILHMHFTSLEKFFTPDNYQKELDYSKNVYINDYGSRAIKKSVVSEILMDWFHNDPAETAAKLNEECIKHNLYSPAEIAGCNFEKQFRDLNRLTGIKNPWTITDKILKNYTPSEKENLFKFFKDIGLDNNLDYEKYYQEIFGNIIEKKMEIQRPKIELLQEKPLKTTFPTMSSTEVKIHRMFDTWFNKMELNPVTFLQKYIAANNNNNKTMDGFWKSVIDVGCSSGGEPFMSTYDTIEALKNFGLIVNNYEEPKLYGPCYNEYVKYMKEYGTPGDIKNQTDFIEEIFPNKNDMIEYLQRNEKLLGKYRGFLEHKEDALFEKYQDSADSLWQKHLFTYFKDLNLFIEPTIAKLAEEKFQKNREYWDSLKSPSKVKSREDDFSR